MLKLPYAFYDYSVENPRPRSKKTLKEKYNKGNIYACHNVCHRVVMFGTNEVKYFHMTWVEEVLSHGTNEALCVSTSKVNTLLGMSKMHSNGMSELSALTWLG